jgi:O-antigen ligase
MTLVFYYFSVDRPVALNELKRGILSITAFFVASNIVTSKEERNWLIGFWLCGSFLAFIYGILQHYGGISLLQVPHVARIMSTFGNPIFFAAHIVIILPIAIGLAFGSKNTFSKMLLFILVIFGVFALYLAQTRAAFIGFAVSLIVFIILSIKETKTKIFILALVVMAAGVFGILTKNMWARNQEHRLIWRDSLVMWSNSPWTGTGPGTFHLYFPKFASEQLKKIWPQQQFVVNDAHNEYVQYLTETGILGFGVFLWLLISFYKTSFLILVKTQGRQRYILCGLIASATGILVQNFFSVDMRFIISAVNLFIVWGIIDSFDDNYYEFDNFAKTTRVAGLLITLTLSFFSFKKVLEPYIAQKIVANTPDFFDEKILEASKTAAEFEELAVKYPEKASIYEKLGWIYAKEKKWEPAIKNYEKAFGLNPALFGPLNNLGNIYFLLNQRDKAIFYWTKSLKINPNQTDSRLNLAMAYYYNGQLKEASDELKKVLELDPKNEKAIVMLKQMVE